MHTGYIYTIKLLIGSTTFYNKIEKRYLGEKLIKIPNPKILRYIRWEIIFQPFQNYVL